MRPAIRSFVILSVCLLVAGCSPEPPDPPPAPGDPPSTPPPPGLGLEAEATAPDPPPAPAASPDAPQTPGVVRVPPPAPPSQAPQEGWTVGILHRASPTGRVGTLVAVRTARQPGYDRVVFEFAGGELPGYHAEYVDRPVRQCGSGDPVPLPGDAWLRVRFEPANAHTDEGRATVQDRDRTLNYGLVKRLALICDFEAQVEWVLALAAPNPYRVLVLSNPARIVVDVQHFRL